MIAYGIGAMVLVGFSWTIFGYVMGRAPRYNIGIPYLMILCSVLAVIISTVTGLCQGFPETTLFGYFITFGVLILCGIVNYFQLDLMSRAMQKGPNGIIWSIIQSGFIFPFFMGIIFFGVKLTAMRLAGLMAMLAALVLFGTGKNQSSGGNWKLPAFGAFVMTGVSQMLSNLPSYYPESEAVSSIWRTAAFSVGMGLGGTLTEILKGKLFFQELDRHLRRGAVWFNCILLELPELVVSFLLLYPGMDILSKAGLGSIAYPIMVCSCIIIFELFSILILHEKRKAAQWLALLLCLGGVIGICL